jgi:hypothetical protein
LGLVGELVKEMEEYGAVKRLDALQNAVVNSAKGIDVEENLPLMLMDGIA